MVALSVAGRASPVDDCHGRVVGPLRCVHLTVPTPVIGKYQAPFPGAKAEMARSSGHGVLHRTGNGNHAVPLQPRLARCDWRTVVVVDDAR